MTSEMLPKYSQIFTINKKRTCRFGGPHSLKEKRVKLYNKNKTISNETVFECKKCKKLFIVQGNKERFLNSYPLYIINQETQDKTLSKKEIKKLHQKEISKKKKEAERNRKELELEKMNSPKEKRKREVNKIINNNNIKVFDERHPHKVFKYSCTFNNYPAKFMYCEECNVLYCMKDEYKKYTKNGVPKELFVFPELEHVNISIFNKKPSKEKNEQQKRENEFNVDQHKKKEEKDFNVEQTELELGFKQIELDFHQKEIRDTKKIEKQKETNTNYDHKKEIILPKADFFVRTSVSYCSQNKHTIIDLIAEVDVICPEGNIIKKTFPASYCVDCKLYFMYEKYYKAIRKSGVPLCSIYEYSKYIKTNMSKGIELKPESLLHSFGYNVGVTENLSSKQRRRILSFVINKGIMGKHEIIGLLNYFVEFRKNDKRQAKAIYKWKMDIDYLQNTNIETDKKVEINSIRVINTIGK